MQLIRLLFLVTLAVHVSSNDILPVHTSGQNHSPSHDDSIPLVDLPAPPYSQAHASGDRPPSYYSTDPHSGAGQVQRPAAALTPSHAAHVTDTGTALVPAGRGSQSALEAQVPARPYHERLTCVQVAVAICVLVLLTIPVAVPVVLYSEKNKGPQSRGLSEESDLRKNKRCDCKDATQAHPDADLNHIPGTKHTRRDVLRTAYRPRITTWGNQVTDLPAEV
ncbi:hypothetical protein F5050DRAFT_1177520 [Lentinula boryana]|uniref:Uncharacterized protein n=1 Tax=Lentinula boryana TaxID=40481 RepID=A0ABQ8PYE6_9AGAR|nr:hypothetical protein F5050DRAFT_1177520 [Lentinula boryana]